ncbi:MAG: flagellar basal body-associated FliL family protein [Nitrospirota bacterium]
MAEEKPEEGKEGEHGEAPKKKGLPILWIIIGLLVVLLIGGAVYFLKFMKGPEDTKGKKGKAHVEAKEGEHGEEGEDHAEEGEEHAEEGEEHAEEGEHAKEGEHAEGGEGEHGEEAAAGGHGEEGGGEKVKCPAPPAAGGHGAPKAAVISETYSLDPFIVNLSGAGDVKFLKVTVKLKLAKAECTRFVDPHVAEIRDSILMLLSSKEYEMVSNVQGKMELRDEILERVKNIVKGGRVKSAFFTDFVAQ